MPFFAIDAGVLEQMERARAAGLTPTADQVAKFEARTAGPASILSTAGNAAEILITGVLTRAPDLYAYYYGGGNTTYPDIIAAIAEADADERVEQIDIRFDSGGGEAQGAFLAATAIANAMKPTRGIVDGMAASAAYLLVSQADIIETVGPADMVGSIGIVQTTYVADYIVEVTSTEAPDKRPDVTTEEGKATVRTYLDEFHGIMAADIARGRGTTVGAVNANFGRGGVMLAAKALDRGMIDRVGVSAPGASTVSQTTATAEKPTIEATTMDLQKLKAEHPAVHAAAHAEGVAAGVKTERERTSAHIQYATTARMPEMALEGIKAGQELTADVIAAYLTAGMNHADVSANQADSDDTPETGADSTDESQEEKLGTAVLAHMQSDSHIVRIK
jgi:ClpP class serine protease